MGGKTKPASSVTLFNGVCGGALDVVVVVVVVVVLELDAPSVVGVNGTDCMVRLFDMVCICSPGSALSHWYIQ